MGFARNACANNVSGIAGVVAESWSQGFLFGGLVVLLLLTFASFRRHVLLHKLIVLELLITTFRGTFCFVTGRDAGWYASATSTLLYISYNLHNIINWIKIKPFLGTRGQWIYLGSLILVWPYWVAETYFIYVYNNDLGRNYFVRLRPWECLCGEPWWLFTTSYLIYIIKRTYGCSLKELIRRSGKFLVLLLAMALSMAFVVADAVVVVAVHTPCRGLNPFWKIAFIFKCTADVIFLDDFKSVLDKISLRGEQTQDSDGLKEAQDGVEHIESCSYRRT